MKIPRLSVGALAALCLCLVAFFVIRRAAPRPASQPSSSTSLPSIQPVAAHAAARITPTATSEPRPVATKPFASVSTSSASHSVRYQGQPIGDVIRNLTTAPADWRTFDPQTLTLRLAEAGDFSFDRLSSKKTADRHTWFGYDRTTGAFVSASATRGAWTAEVANPGTTSYRLTAGSQVVVTSGNPARFVCADVVPVALREAGARLPTVNVDRLAATETELANVNISSVGVMYDADTEADITRLLNAAGSTETVQSALTSFLTDSIDLANIFLELSEVDNLQWELAGVAKIPAYSAVDNARMRQDLRVLGGYSTEEASRVATNFFAEKRADQGVLIVGGHREIDGLGETPGNYSVVSWYNDSYLSYLLAHEMGHNFGCNHDRVTEQAPDGNGQYAYGHTLTAGTKRYATLMSYIGDSLLPVYSNPEVSFKIFEAGIDVPLGVPANQPKAAYNVRKIREQAAAIASFRKHADDPVITVQPSAQNIRVGQTLSLSVTASGPNLKYQWYKDETAIANATGATCTKTDAAITDSGSYRVALTTYRNTLLSLPVTVSVSTAPPVITTGGGGGGSGGGGGGGGAPSYWFLTALALAAICRGWRCLSGQ